MPPGAQPLDDIRESKECPALPSAENTNLCSVFTYYVLRTLSASVVKGQISRLQVEPESVAARFCTAGRV